MATKEWIDKNQDKMREYRRRYYAKNKESETKRIRQRITDNKLWFQELKSTLKCTKCPENHPACLEFHHTDPKSKDMDISMAIHYGWSQERILSEIAKCVCLCANCHRKEHY